MNHINEFINDCKRELDRHNERCATDPNYCMGYIQSWEPNINIPDKAYNDLNENELKELINELEMVLMNGCDNSLYTAIKSLLNHLKIKLKDIDSFTAAVEELSKRMTYSCA